MEWLELFSFNFRQTQDSLEEFSLVTFSVKSAVEVKGGALAGEGNSDCWWGLVDDSSVSWLGDTGNSMNVYLKEIAFSETLNWNIHTSGLVNRVSAWVRWLSTSEEVSEPPIEVVATTVGNANLRSWSCTCGISDGEESGGKCDCLHIKYFLL